MRWILAALFLLAANPALAAERILALAPHICEILFAVGAGDEVVGGGDYCDYPADAKRLPRVADYRQVYVEAALRLKPTLAIALRDNLPGMAELSRHGVLLAASDPHSVQGMLDDMLRLGRLAGYAAGAEHVVAGLKRRLQAMHDARPAAHPRVFYEIWQKPLIAAGGASLINSVLSELGLVNVFADIPQEGPRVSVESVLLARPDIIVLSSQSNVQARERFWRKWFSRRPVRFVVADADLLHRPGPRLIAGMQQLQAAVVRVLHE
jgi:iron complex transport system substrate-binding protein